MRWNCGTESKDYERLMAFYKDGGSFKGKYIYFRPDQSVHAWVVSDVLNS